MESTDLFPGIYGHINLSELNRTQVIDCSTLQQNRTLQNVANGNYICSTAGKDHTAISGDGQLMLCIYGNIDWTSEEIKSRSKNMGPAATLLDLYRSDRSNYLSHCKGNFTIALIDRASRKVDLSIDHFGIQALSYSLNGNELIFCPNSEQVARSLPNSHQGYSQQSIYDYFYFHMIPSPFTFYKNVRKLEPASSATISVGQIQTDIYWKPDYEPKHKLCKRSSEELVGLLSKSVRNCSSDSVAAFLSGGLDSTSIVGLLSKLQNTDTHAFTIGFDEPGYDETSFARVAAEYYGVRLTETYVSPDDIVESLPVIASIYDEPFGNSSVIPTYHCARIASEHGYRTIVAGDGGDELFAGNERYQTQMLLALYHRVPRVFRERIIEPSLFKLLGGVTRFPIPKLRGYVNQANTPLPLRTQAYNFLHRFEPSDIFSQSFSEGVDATHPERHLESTYGNASTEDMVERLLYLDWKITLADNDLRKVTKMCKANGLSVCYPMLDDDVVAFSTSIPSKEKLTSFELRRFYRRSFAPILPKATLKKSKHGFGIPFGLWISKSDNLRGFVTDSLDRFSERNIIQNSYVKQLTHTLGKPEAAYYGGMVWLIVMLETWLHSRKQYSAIKF